MKITFAVRGLAAGLAGVAAMTAAEKLEQALSGRPTDLGEFCIPLAEQGRWGGSSV